jgi:superfamily II DNA/RNA helicase
MRFFVPSLWLVGIVWTTIAAAFDAPPPSSHFFSRKSLSDPRYHVDATLFQNLCQSVALERPSKIQNLAWPILLQRQQQQRAFLIADQTGFLSYNWS